VSESSARQLLNDSLDEVRHVFRQAIAVRGAVQPVVVLVDRTEPLATMLDLTPASAPGYLIGTLPLDRALGESSPLRPETREMLETLFGVMRGGPTATPRPEMFLVLVAGANGRITCMSALLHEPEPPPV
jgi:hypothetical protein